MQTYPFFFSSCHSPHTSPGGWDMKINLTTWRNPNRRAVAESVRSFIARGLIVSATENPDWHSMDPRLNEAECAQHFATLSYLQHKSHKSDTIYGTGETICQPPRDQTLGKKNARFSRPVFFRIQVGMGKFPRSLFLSVLQGHAILIPLFYHT